EKSSALHRYTYDRRGLLSLTEWDPSGVARTEADEYDAFGRIAKRTDQYGNTARFTYDRLGRTLTNVDALSSAHATAYDAFDRTLTTTDALGNVTKYRYVDGTVGVAGGVAVTTPEGIVVTTIYDREGEKLSVTSAGNTTTYGYDRNGNLLATSDGL